MDVRRLFYPKASSNFLNYSILLVSLSLASSRREDYRMWVVLVASSLLQILVGPVLQFTFGISTIYCALFGYLLKRLYDEKKYLDTLVYSLLLIPLFVFVGYDIAPPNVPLYILAILFPIFLINHSLLVGIGVLGGMLPKRTSQGVL